MLRSRVLTIALIAALALTFACKRGGISTHEYAYVAANNVNVRDRLAAVYNKVATLNNGDKVDVIARGIGEKKAGQANAPTGLKPKPRPAPPVTTKPGKPDKNAAIAKEQKQPEQSAAALPAQPPAKTAKPPEPEAPKVYEDWWLVRNSEGKTGWVLSRMIDLDVPLEIAQYAEGQRIMAYTILNTVEEDGKQVPQYLVATNENKDGLPWDFNAIRVFSRNRARHRYETAYRERNLFGLLPIKTGTQEFEKEGVLPYF